MNASRETNTSVIENPLLGLKMPGSTCGASTRRQGPGGAPGIGRVSQRPHRRVRIREPPHDGRDAARGAHDVEERALLDRGDVAADLALEGREQRERAADVLRTDDDGCPADDIAASDTEAVLQVAAVRELRAPDVVAEQAHAER